MKSLEPVPNKWVKQLDISKVLVAERVAGVMLLFSALVDSVLLRYLAVERAAHQPDFID
ncbi:hypothetical protein OK016_19835 [Vibrio chagasii]|nr:hypothetical protein [Vibrio chagasii]